MLFLCTQIWGHVDVFIDMPVVNDNEVKTEKDRTDAGIRPYLITIFPIDFLNWEIDLDGKFKWIR